VRGTFDYRLRLDQGEVAVGSLLRIPFGGRRALGVVVGLAEHSDVAPDRLAEPEAVLPSSIPPELVALAGWMAEEYCSTSARALGLVLAPGATGRRCSGWTRTARRSPPSSEPLACAGLRPGGWSRWRRRSGDAVPCIMRSGRPR